MMRTHEVDSIQPNFIPDNISEIDSSTHKQPLHTLPMLNNHITQHSQIHRFGALHIKYVLFFFIPLLIGVCMYTYHQATKKHEEKPFPHATITNTACHFSQDLTFRFIMLSAQSFLHLIYFIAFKWVKMIVKRTKYPGQDLSWLYPIAQISVFGFFAAIGTIDGAGYPNIHSIGAVSFFIILFVLALNITLLVRDIYKWDPSAINYNSVLQKTILIIILSLIVAYCVVGLLTEAVQNDDDIYVVIMEWNLVFLGLMWLLTFSSDWTSVFLTLKGDIRASVKKIQI